MNMANPDRESKRILLVEDNEDEYKEQVERMESAKEKRLRAEEKLVRFKAEKAFLEGGGARGEFARRWPSVFVEEAHSHLRFLATREINTASEAVV